MSGTYLEYKYILGSNRSSVIFKVHYVCGYRVSETPVSIMVVAVDLEQSFLNMLNPFTTEAFQVQEAKYYIKQLKVCKESNKGCQCFIIYNTD